MKLTHLNIINCSRVADIHIEVRGNMVLIGPNGSGKLTVGGISKLPCSPQLQFLRWS